MGKRKTYKDVKLEVESQGSTLLDKEYINNTHELNMVCKCGNPFNKSYKVMHRSGFYICNDCIKNIQDEEKIIPLDIIKQRLETIGMRIIVDEKDYKGVNYKYNFECIKYGHKTNSWLKDVLNKNKGCKTCHNIQKGINQMIPYEELVYEYDKIGMTVLTSKEDYYNDISGFVDVLCKNGHKFSSNIGNFRHKDTGCPECFNDIRGSWSLVSYEDRVLQVEKEGYKMITKKEDYIDGSTCIILECPNGHQFITTMNNFTIGLRCPFCDMSYGEAKIDYILNSNNIKYEIQYRFNDCRLNKPLPFDFYLPDYNTCIEYDGKQHFKYGCFKGNLLDLMNIKYRDNIKTQYCIDNNIKLIRIPYWDFDNIEEILIKELNL